MKEITCPQNVVFICYAKTRAASDLGAWQGLEKNLANQMASFISSRKILSPSYIFFSGSNWTFQSTAVRGWQLLMNNARYLPHCVATSLSRAPCSKSPRDRPVCNR